MNGFNNKGKRHGPWEVYYDNGKLYWRGNYVNGNGLFERYFSNGNVWYKINFVNGKKCGLEERYWDNAKLYIKQYWL